MKWWMTLTGLVAIGALGCGPKFHVAERAAHDFRCPESRLKIKRVSGTPTTGTYEAEGCGKTGLYTTLCEGNECIVRAEANAADLSGTEPAPPPPPPRKPTPRKDVDPPEGLAGFRFGMSKTEAEAACEEAEHEYTAVDDNDAKCSAPVAPVGFESEVNLDFCGDSLCRIRVTRALPGARRLGGAVDPFKEMLELLEEKYAPPASGSSTSPGGATTFRPASPTTPSRCVPTGRWMGIAYD